MVAVIAEDAVAQSVGFRAEEFTAGLRRSAGYLNHLSGEFARAAASADPGQLRVLAGAIRRVAIQAERLVEGWEFRAAMDGAEPGPLDVHKILAHEARSPLCVISGSAGLIEKSADRLDRKTLAELVTSLRRNATGLEALLEFLSEAYGMETGALELGLQGIDLAELTREVVGDMGLMSPGRRFHLSISGSARVVADPHLVRGVLVNLLTNAVKFSPDEAPIEITLANYRDRFEITVSDYGSGIDEGMLEAVFAKYSRLDPSLPGKGLGLYIARKIARAHGGDVDVSSRPGRGSRFTLRLPAAGG